jgi:hypothetical protein
MLAAYDRDEIAFVGAWIIALLLFPASFTLSFWIAKRFCKDEKARGALTTGLGLIFFAAGLIATVAGCAALQVQ